MKWSTSYPLFPSSHGKCFHFSIFNQYELMKLIRGNVHNPPSGIGIISDNQTWPIMANISTHIPGEYMVNGNSLVLPPLRWLHPVHKSPQGLGRLGGTAAPNAPKSTKNMTNKNHHQHNKYLNILLFALNKSPFPSFQFPMACLFLPTQKTFWTYLQYKQKFQCNVIVLIHYLWCFYI